MQRLTDPPRQDLTDTAVLDLIQAPGLQVSAGAELVTFDADGALQVGDDLTEDLQADGGSVTWDGTAAVNRSCQINLARELNWGTDLIRLRMDLSDGTVTASFYVGVFSLTSPAKVIGTDPVIYPVTGYDRLYLLQRQVGDTYSVEAGSAYLQAVADVIDAAELAGVQIDQSAAAVVLPSDMVWPLVPSSGEPTTYLDIANELLTACGYSELWADENGQFRAEPYVPPATRPAEFTLDADDSIRTIVGQSRTLTQDVWHAPNKWIFVQSGFTGVPTEGDGIYTVTNQSDGPASIDGRGGVIEAQQFSLDAADRATLMLLGDAQVTADKASDAVFTLPTGPLPTAGNNDVIALSDTSAPWSANVLATGWQLPLDGSMMSWTLKAVA